MGDNIVEWPLEPACCGEEREGRSSALTVHVNRKAGRRKLWPTCLSEEIRSKTAIVYVSPDTQLDHFREGGGFLYVFELPPPLCREVGLGPQWR